MCKWAGYIEIGFCGYLIQRAEMLTGKRGECTELEGMLYVQGSESLARFPRYKFIISRVLKKAGERNGQCIVLVWGELAAMLMAYFWYYTHR